MKTRLVYRNLAGRSLLAALLLFALLFSLAPARALAWGETFDGSPGTGAPPATLGPYTMQPFALDTRDLDIEVTTVPGPTGDIVFTEPVEHRRVPDGWATWSHGYTGDVYYRPEAMELTIILPPNTLAFYLYAEPNPMNEHPITVTSNGVSSGAVPVLGNAGATYFGFYSVGSPLEYVTITSDAEFAVGEFGIATGTAAGSTPNTGSPRADVGVVIYGGWGGIPVQAWVGGTLQPALHTAPNHEGEAAVLFTFWPPEGKGWSVSVGPSLPAELDAAAWELKLVGMKSNGRWVTSPTAEFTVTRGSEYVLYYQLLHKH